MSPTKTPKKIYTKSGSIYKLKWVQGGFILSGGWMDSHPDYATTIFRPLMPISLGLPCVFMGKHLDQTPILGTMNKTRYKIVVTTPVIRITYEKKEKS
jgi:hypothetical protein